MAIEPASADRFPERMAIAVAKVGGVAELAQKTGLSEGVIRKYLRGQSEPSRDRLIAVAEGAKVSVQWLATGEDVTPHHVRALEHPIGDNSMLPDGWATFPVYRVAAAAGHGLVPPDEEYSHRLAAENRWFSRTVRANPANVAGVFVAGDSMEPTFYDGDIVLVDTQRKDLAADGIYVFRVDDVLLVKRCRRQLDGKVIVSSDNPLYPPQTIDPRKEDLAIYGRVVAAFKHY